jgi:lysozyme family protein
MTENFNYAVSQTLDLEGGYSNDPGDPGGETKFGITHITLDEAYRRGIVSHNVVKNLTADEAKQIYFVMYYQDVKLDLISDKYISATLFDCCVNMGQGAPGKIAQKALVHLEEIITVDGAIGPITINLINKWGQKDRRAFFTTINCEKYIHYKEIIANKPSQAQWARGWMHRIQQYQFVWEGK